MLLLGVGLQKLCILLCLAQLTWNGQRTEAAQLAAVDFPGGLNDAARLERSFMFRNIEVDDADGKTSFVDEWMAIA